MKANVIVLCRIYEGLLLSYPKPAKETFKELMAYYVDACCLFENVTVIDKMLVLNDENGPISVSLILKERYNRKNKG